jgi:hypothetical protein
LSNVENEASDCQILNRESSGLEECQSPVATLDSLPLVEKLAKLARCAGITTLQLLCTGRGTA